jgi:alkylation response protein AidB-like acyl-CoA dehydrogenase
LTKILSFHYHKYFKYSSPSEKERRFLKDIEKERQMIRELAIKTAQKVVEPRAAEIDTTGKFPRDLSEALGKQGFLSMILPDQYGGYNANITLFCLVIEEIAKVSGSSSQLILSQGIGAMPLWVGGNPSQQEYYFTQISEKYRLTAFALNESEGGAEPVSLQTRAGKKGDFYFLNGHKYFITNGSVAHIYSVFAVTDPDQGLRGITAFVVEDGTPGLIFSKREEKIGMRGSVTSDVIFENCQVPKENLLGEEGEGWKIAMKTLNLSRPAIGAQAVGIAQGALDYAIRYANERIQFRKPISSFQAIQFMVADMATRIEAARTLVYQTAAKIDIHLDDTEKLSAMAKYFASEVAMKVTTDAVQILGGYGYMRDYPVERMMRDAKVTQVHGEPNQVQRMVIAHHLLKE